MEWCHVIVTVPSLSRYVIVAVHYVFVMRVWDYLLHCKIRQWSSKKLSPSTGWEFINKDNISLYLCIPFSRKADVHIILASLLTHGLHIYSAFPAYASGTWSRPPHSQWPDRSGFPPDSFLINYESQLNQNNDYLVLLISLYRMEQGLAIEGWNHNGYSFKTDRIQQRWNIYVYKTLQLLKFTE